jgi:hypothetical protein
MSGLEVEIGEWRISLPQAWTYLDGQTFTFFKSGPELGQFQISTARQVSGPGTDLGASGQNNASEGGHRFRLPATARHSERQTRQIIVVWGDLDSNRTYVGRIWFAPDQGGCLEEIGEAHEALLSVHVVTR